MPEDHTVTPAPAGNDADTIRYAKLRERMVNKQLADRGITDHDVLRAFRKVPRHLFVDSRSRGKAYADQVLETEEGQTISQPYIVGLMTQALQPKSARKVLEIGTGSGYQTAILAELAKHVYTVERVQSLAEGAAARLHELGYANFSTRQADGSLGWPEEAPFDRIIVTAGAPEPPKPLVEQLADGGRMVIPIGPHDGQELTLITKSGGEVRRTFLCACIFVRLIGEAAWDK